MKTNPVAYEMSLNRVERAWLELRIEHWFTSSYETRERLFGDIDKSMNLLNIAQQIKSGAITIRFSKYQAQVVAEVIYHNERRMDCKTCKEYLPKGFDHRDLYDELVKIANH